MIIKRKLFATETTEIKQTHRGKRLSNMKNSIIITAKHWKCCNKMEISCSTIYINKQKEISNILFRHITEASNKTLYYNLRETQKQTHIHQYLTLRH